MASYNKIILVGNLTRDPQLKFLPSQMAVCDFGMAVNHKFKTKDGQEKEEVLFVDCTCFGRGGEVINQYCKKGKQILVEGRLRYESWEDKQGGGKRSKHTVTVDNFQLLGGPQEGGGGEDREAYPKTRPQSSSRQPAASPISDAEEFTDDSIPF